MDKTPEDATATVAVASEWGREIDRPISLFHWKGFTQTDVKSLFLHDDDDDGKRMRNGDGAFDSDEGKISGQASPNVPRSRQGRQATQDKACGEYFNIIHAFVMENIIQLRERLRYG